MDTLTATIKELLHFVFIEWFGFRVSSTHGRTLYIQTPQRKLLTGGVIVPPHTTESTVSRADTDSQHICVQKAMVYEQPVQEFDGVVGILPYGARVKIHTTQGRWAQVSSDHMNGWVLRDDLVDGAHQIEPQFLLGEEYRSGNEETEKLRAIIADEFGGGQLEYPLQDTEYVLYKLKTYGHTIVWPDTRPRLAGRWQRILAGHPGIHIGIHPKTHAVMEVINADGSGHVSFVESVFPDQSILVSEVGVPEEGQYNEHILPYPEWRELRPIFIEIA